jgi:lysophospholipase L1-like esterase
MSQIYTTEAQVQAIINSIITGQRNSAGGLVGLNENAQIEPQYIASALGVGNGGAITTSSTPPSDSVNRVFFPSQTGTYTNFSSIAVTLSDGLNLIVGSQTGGFTKVVTPITLTDYVTNANLASKIAPEVKLQNLALEYTPASNAYEPVVKSAAIFRDTTSTFSGWGFPIGSPQNFDSIIFRLRTRSNAVTKIAYSLYTGGFSTVVLEKTIDVNLAANTAFDITIVFDSLVANSADADLYFFYRCNQFIDHYSVQGATVPFPNPTFEAARYVVNGALTGIGTQISSPTTGQRNMWFITSVIGAKIKDFTKNIVSQEIEDDIKALFNTTEDEAFQNSFIQTIDKENETPIFDESSASYQQTTSTFSGWNTPLGTPQIFNCITFKVRARANAITSIRCIVRVNSNGTNLGDKTVTVNIPANTVGEVTVLFDSIIANSSQDKLAFIFQCNQFCDSFGIMSSTQFPMSGGYDNSYYFVNGVQTGGVGEAQTINPSGTRFITFAKVSKGIQIVGFKKNLLDWVADNLNITPVNPVFEPSAELILPSRIYAAQGVESNIYWDNVIFANVPIDSLTIDVVSTRGQQFEKGWRYTPGAETGTSSLQIRVFFEGRVLADKTTTIVIQNSAGGVGSKKILAIGDSTTAGGQYISLITSSYGTNPSVTFIGTRGTSPNKHEGYGGYSFNSFISAGTLTYRFTVSGITIAPALGSVYSNNSSQFTVLEINLSGSSGSITCSRTSGANDPLASGTLTNVSGGGDATISFSASEIISGNPFWISGALNFAQYLTNNSFTLASSDLVTIHLGINDVFNDSSDTNISTIITRANTLINAIRTGVPNINIGLCLTIPPAISQDSFGTNYSNGRNLKEYLVGYRKLINAFLTEFDTNARRTDKVWTIPFNVGIDRTYNFPTSQVNANARNTTQITRWTNSVHPATSGYQQMGDILWAFIKNLA